MPRYELVEGTSSKFWEITLAGLSFTVRYGRIGTEGQSQVKAYDSEAKALAEHDKLVKEKTKKGYAEVRAAAVAPAAPAARAARPAPVAAPIEVAEAPPSDGWLDAGKGYMLTVRDAKIVARNAKGKELASVPKEVKESEAFLQLQEALEILEAHAVECRQQVELWMLRSLPVPRAVLAAVWPDPDWRAVLENAVILVDGTDGGGIFRGVDAERGLGVVTLDGETVWLQAEEVWVPHPILLQELDDWRSLLAEVGLQQGLSQLFRETFTKPADTGDGKADETWNNQWSGGEFPLLASAMGEARRGGYRVRGGSASTTIFEGERSVEARYELGEGDPMYETTTGGLCWVDAEGRCLPMKAVGPVAWSEGMRMAASIYKKRTVEEKQDDENA